MDDKRLEKMEDMIATLITMTANTNQSQQRLEVKMDELSERQTKLEVQMDELCQGQDQLEQEQRTMRTEMQENHNEVISRLRKLDADQDHIWEKTVRNERQIARVEAQLNS